MVGKAGILILPGRGLRLRGHLESVYAACPIHSPQKTCRTGQNALEGGRELLHQKEVPGKVEEQVHL